MKKGFVFIETIIVLMLVTMSLTMLISSYTLIKTKSLEKESYDKTSDKYLLYAISTLGTTSQYNYSLIADTGYLSITPEDCGNLQNSIYTLSGDTITKINCTSNKNDPKCQFFKIFDYDPSVSRTTTTTVTTTTKSETVNNKPNCQTVFSQLNVVHIYVIPDVAEALNSSTATSIYDNGTINYLKTLRKCYDSVYITDEEGNQVVSDEVGTCYDPVRYMVGVFQRYGEYYFASIEI